MRLVLRSVPQRDNFVVVAAVVVVVSYHGDEHMLQHKQNMYLIRYFQSGGFSSMSSLM